MGLTMEVITFSLRDGQKQSDQYYRDIAAFADQVLDQGEEHLHGLVDTFQSDLAKANDAGPRTRYECLFELLTVGILWRIYGCQSLDLPEVPRQVLTGLVRLRERGGWLKPGIDGLRSLLGAVFLSRRVPSSPPPLFTSDRLGRFLSWLAATGEFSEEAKRLTPWHDLLSRQPAEQVALHWSAVNAFAEWFETQSLAALGRYTPHVERFLSQTSATYRWREDALFCSRRRVEYHLNMVGTEILNRVFRDEFLDRPRKIVFVPPCMRFQPEERCQAQPTPWGARCAACTPSCRVHQLTKLGEKYGFAVLTLPDELSVLSKDRTKPAGGQDLGAVGVSCALTNAPGGWETRALGIPAQGVLLDYCGCRWHWHREGIPTDVNFQQLLRVLGITRDAAPTVRDGESIPAAFQAR